MKMPLRLVLLLLTVVACAILILGGGLGNLIDRLANDGHVIDFVSVGIGSLRTGIFNLADVAITAGVVTVFLSLAKSHAEPDPNRAE